MGRLLCGLLFSISFLVTTWVFAQDSDQSTSGSGVLVSSPVHEQVQDQDNTGNSENSGVPDPSAQPNSDNSGHHRHHHADGNSDSSSQNTTGNSSDGGEL